MRCLLFAPAMVLCCLTLATLSSCGGEEGGAIAAPSEFIALEGSWTRSHASGHYVYTFTSSESADLFTHESFALGTPTPVNSSSGNASALNSHLALWTACDLSTGTPGSQEVGPFAIHEDAFSRDQVYLPLTPDQGIVGVWTFAWERFVDLDCAGYPDHPNKTRTNTLELRDDGTSRFTSAEMTTTAGGSFVPLGEPIDREGTWSLEGEGGVQKVTTIDAQLVNEYELSQSGALVDLNPSYWYFRD